MTELLRIDGLQVRFGAVDAVHDLDLTLHAGTVTGLIGPNGAGKTTLIDAVMGFVTPTRGSVVFNGESVAGLAPHQRTRLGLARTFQAAELFEDMTVAENVLVAAESRGAGSDEATAAATRAGLAGLDGRTAAHLSTGERKSLALARALAGRPLLLMLDEPAAGLDRAERRRLVDTLRDLRGTGMTVVLVDHDVDLVLEVCDRVVVLDLGAVVYDGPPAGVREDTRVAAAYLGTALRSQPEAAATRDKDTADLVVHTRGLSCGYGDTTVVRDIDLQVRTGERVALLGPNGAGKTTTLLTLSGALAAMSGDVDVLGAAPAPAHRLARRGAAHVMQDHKVFATLTVAENLRLAGANRDMRDRLCDLFPAIGRVIDRQAGACSGGEQQMLALARALAKEPRLLLVDELSLGLAPTTVTALYDALSVWQRQSGGAVLFAEQHAEQALRFADRAYVLAAGRIVVQATAAELAAAPELLTQAYFGPDRG